MPSAEERSIGFEGSVREAAGGIALRIAGAVVAGVVLLVFAALGRLPAPLALENMEETVLTAKARLATGAEAARAVLIGDSTCLMHLDPAVLGPLLGEPPLNLGLWREFTFDAFAELLAARAAAGRLPEQIIVAVHPSTLRRARTDPHALELLRAALAGRDRPTDDPFGRFRRPWDWAQDRLLNRIIPRPLPEAYRSAYGSTLGLMHALERSKGFLPARSAGERPKVRGRAEYWISPELDPALRAFRDAASEAAIWIVLSPIPRSMALRDTETELRRLADSIAAHLMPAHVLPTPVLWEDADFIDSMHLHERAAQEFSAAVGQGIQRFYSDRPLTSP